MDVHLPIPADSDRAAGHMRAWVSTRVTETIPRRLQKAKDIVQAAFGERCQSEPLLVTLNTEIGSLAESVTTNGEIVPLTDSLSDVQEWNRSVTSLTCPSKDGHTDGQTDGQTAGGKTYHLMDVPLLWMESYLTRRLVGALSTANLLKDDDFQETKSDAFFKCTNFFTQTSMHLRTALNEIQQQEDSNTAQETSARYLQEFVTLSAWGSILATKYKPSEEGYLSLDNPVKEAAKLQDRLLISKPELIPQILQPKSKEQDGAASATTSRRVDIVLGGTQMDLFADMCVAELLIASKMASVVVFHGPEASDHVEHCSEADFLWLLRMLNMVNHMGLARLLGSSRQRLDDGQWRFQTDSFWGLPAGFRNMKEEAPGLFTDMAKSSLVMLKGERNYRKLLDDRQWDPETSLQDVCSGLELRPLCVISRLESPVAVGIPPGRLEEWTNITTTPGDCPRTALIDCLL